MSKSIKITKKTKKTQKRPIRRGTRNLCGSKLRRYAAFMIDLNEYLDFFPQAKLYDKIGVTELNEKFLNSMPTIWIKQVYVQGFYCEYITIKKAVTMFYCTNIS